MSNYAISLKRTSTLLAALAFTALLLVVNFASFFSKADAAQLTNRSLTLSSTLPGTENGDGTGGSPTNGADATWTFTFDTVSANTDVITFVVCDDPVSSICTMPAGLNVGAAANGTGGVAGVIAPVAGGDPNDFTFDATTPFGASTVSIVVDGIVNPDVIDAFFVRITTDSGDDGVVASAITEGIEITARVKETLGFSTTGAVATGGGNGIPAPTTACVPLTGSGAITIGDPTENALSMTAAFNNYTAFRLYTNAANGVSVTYEGETLTRSGSSDTINEIGGTAVLADDTTAGNSEQFGLAVDGTVGGTSPAVDSLGANADFTNADVAADFAGGAGQLAINAEYANGGTDFFAFLSGAGPQEIADSTSYVNCVTVPIKYVANITPLTPSGTYTTTLVYTAVPEY